MALTRQFEVTGDRDRVFGLLGLKTWDADPDNGRFFMEPDYSLSVEQVYHEVVARTLRKNKNLRILSSVQHGSYSNQHEYVDTLTLPSWVPQWNSVFCQSLLLADPEENHAAAGGLPHYSQCSTDRDHLIVRGLELDTISECLPIVCSIRDLLPPGVIARQDLRYYFRTKAGLNILSRTITAGKGWYGMRVSNEPDHVVDLAAYLSSIEGAAEEQLGWKVYPCGPSDRKSVVYETASRLSH
jgi:hypothetical protein